ncbi:MAG: biotin/lipoyl-containing protein [Pseudomonadota bacterium]
MKHRLEIGGQVRDVDAIFEGGTLTLTVGDGPTMELPCRALPDGRLLLETDGRTACAITASDGATTWVFVDGRAWKVEDADRAAPRRGRRRDAELGDVTPPMPAAVVRILVEPGDVVTRGQGLVVVSAMKMETTLVAPHAGVVSHVHTMVGEKVAPGDVLVDVTATAPEGDGPGEES